MPKRSRPTKTSANPISVTEELAMELFTNQVLAGIAIERLLFKPLAKAPVLTNVAGFIALFAIVNSVAGLIWDFTIKQYPTPFGSSPFLGSQLISTHQAGMIGVTLL